MPLQPRPDGSYNLRDVFSSEDIKKIRVFAKEYGINVGEDGIVSHDDFHRLRDGVQVKRIELGHTPGEPPPRD